MGFKQSKSIKIPSGEESKVQPVPAEPPLVQDGMEGTSPQTSQGTADNVSKTQLALSVEDLKQTDAG